MQFKRIRETEVSRLGFGAMRLPTINGDNKKIDYELAVPMVRHAIDQGVNYLDTAWPYHSGASEAFCAKVMEDGYREKVLIATKSPVWEVNKPQDLYGFLNQQMENLKVDCIDFYLLHALNVDNWERCQKGDYKTFLDNAKASKKIQYAGFSFHDDLTLFKEIIDDYDWDFCQIQLNYMDESYQAGLEGMAYAKSKGIGVVVMEPLRGGTLSKTELPAELSDIWNKSEIKRTPAEWALKYLWNKDNVDVVLSGMSELWQVEENIRVASETAVDSLNNHEIRLIEEAKQFFISRTVVNCTNCQYCMPCPRGVNIPENFWALNHDALFDDSGKTNFWVNDWLNPSAQAKNCNQCGQCEIKCPQNIEIRKYLNVVDERYGKVKA